MANRQELLTIYNGVVFLSSKFIKEGMVKDTYGFLPNPIIKLTNSNKTTKILFYKRLENLATLNIYCYNLEIIPEFVSLKVDWYESVDLLTHHSQNTNESLGICGS